jgi:hypothetical protein
MSVYRCLGMWVCGYVAHWEGEYVGSVQIAYHPRDQITRKCGTWYGVWVGWFHAPASINKRTAVVEP